MISHAVGDVTREAKPWIERLARIGYFAIGAVYIIAGGLTAATALGNRGGTADRGTALSFILDKPFGRAILFVMALGLAGYAFWRIVSGITDSDHRGSDAKGMRARAGAIGSGVVYGALMIEIVRLAFLRTGGAGGGNAASHWTARMMDLPLGRWIAAAAGAAIVGIGVYQLVRAWRSELSERLRLGSLGITARSAVIAISRFGIAARGVVLVIIGVSVMTAALRHDPGAARGMAGAFSALMRQPFGQTMLAVVATGFVAYGVYAIVNGIYRQIDTTASR